MVVRGDRSLRWLVHGDRKVASLTAKRASGRSGAEDL